MTKIRGKKFRPNPVPAVVVIQVELAVFGIIQHKGYVDGFFLILYKFKLLFKICNFANQNFELINKIIKFLLKKFNLKIIEGIPKAKAII